MARVGPLDRVRDRWAGRVGVAAARELPDGYQRLGRVVLVRWPEPLRPHFAFLADALAEELGADTVARWVGPVETPRRRPQLELLHGTETETEVVEDGVRYRFDAARILYSRGNRSERAREAREVRPGERVADLFAGIGYFALPIARHADPAEVVAVEENPVAAGYLRTNIARNRLAGRVTAVEGDNRTVDLPMARFDRVLLGFLPDASPWLPRAVALVRPEGGMLHLHGVAGSRDPPDALTRSAERVLAAAGASLASAVERRVKPYGPGRDHRVADLRVRPGPRGAG